MFQRLILLGLAACAPTVPPDPVDADVAQGVGLTAALATSEIRLPDDSRGGALPTSQVALDGPWTLIASRGGHTMWQTPLPLRTRTLFFFNPPDGMRVLDAEGAPVRFNAATGPSWSFDAEYIRVRVPQGHAPEGWSIGFPPAVERESALNYSFSGAESPEGFVHTAIQDGPTSRSGVLLPAPGRIAWDLTLPPAAELRMTAGIAPSEVLDGEPSDGAVAVVEVTPNGAMQATRVARIRLGETFEPVRIPLGEYSGQSVRLTVSTEPNGSSRADYAFFADAAVTSNETDPERIILVFIDTLRPDHLSFNGYERETSPTLDALARESVVFDQARSVAPWTLPTARAITTGRHPEVYDVATTLQRRFRDAGWATAMFAGNVFLSTNFGMNRDWGLHHVTNWPGAAEQVDHSLAWLERQRGRDALLMVHFMDAHLPYLEPDAYRRRFAGDAPGDLGDEFHRGQVLRADQDDPAVRAYIEGRYDNNIRYIDDQLARLLAGVGDDATVVVFSDHGEEFWDHGGFEHGHTLYDELLRVPLIIRTSGASGRIPEMVSLIDLAPTVLDVAGLDADNLDGTSLLPVIEGDVDARSALLERSQAIGRPLYGDIRWGVLHGKMKWTTHRGQQRLVDILADPDEAVDRLQANPDLADAYPQYLGEALGTYVPEVLRLTATATREPADLPLELQLTVPGGIEAAWVADDPTGASQAFVRTSGDVATITWPRRYRATREVYVLPAAPIADIAAELSATATLGTETDVMSSLYDPELSAIEARSLLWGRVGGRQLNVNTALVPLPFEDGKPLDATDPELAAALQEMGYAVEDGGDADTE